MRLLPHLVFAALPTFAAWAQEAASPASPQSLMLTASVVSVVLPAEAGGWKADVQRDESGAADLLVRDAAGLPDLRVALALAPPGESCNGMLARLARRGGMSLFDRPAWASARWHAQATDETDFEAGAQIQAICAPLTRGALAVVVSHGGDAAALGGADGALGRLLDSVLAAFDMAAGSVATFAPTGPPLPAAASLVARLRFMADPASATAALAVRSGSFTLPAGSGVLVTIEEKVTSKKAEKDQKIKASVAQDVVLDDAVLIKKGTPVVARVGEVDAAGLGGSGGSIKIEIDSTTAVDGQTVALHYQSQTKEGEDTRGLSVTGLFTGWGLLSKGKNVEIASGTKVEAKSTTAVTVKAGS